MGGEQRTSNEPARIRWKMSSLFEFLLGRQKNKSVKPAETRPEFGEAYATVEREEGGMFCLQKRFLITTLLTQIHFGRQHQCQLEEVPENVFNDFKREHRITGRPCDAFSLKFKKNFKNKNLILKE